MWSGKKLTTNLDASEDVVRWRWAGWHDFEPETRKQIEQALDSLKQSVPLARPILVDLADFRFSYTDGAGDAFTSALRLARHGYRIAVLVTKRLKRYAKATKVDRVLDCFETEELAKAFLVSSELPAHKRPGADAP